MIPAPRHITARDGARIGYRTAGDGPPVVLLHGLAQTSAIWWENGVAPALAPDFRVIAPDTRGHGASDRPRDPQGYGTRLVHDILDVIDAESAAPARLVGFSMGADLALRLAADHPGHAAGTLLIGSGWSSADLRDVYLAIALGLAARPPEPDRHDAEALLALAEAMDTILGLPEQAVSGIGGPVAGIIGAADPERPFAEKLAALRPDFTLTLLPGLAHEESCRAPELPGLVRAFAARP